MVVFLALAILGGLTLVLAITLVFANKQLYVYEDPRIDKVEEMLPHANCGACGFPGCRPFGEALVAGKVLPGKCTVGTSEAREKIAQYLDISLGEEEKRVARLACAGGANVARNKANYNGLPSCQAASLISGGGKGCFWGCIGFGDCEAVCEFDAIQMDGHGLPVVNSDKCTACGDCVEVCPKGLFSLEPVSHKLWVACKNLEFGDKVLEDCEVGCTACGKCVVDAAPNLIEMINNLPVIDYGANRQGKEAIDRCATGAIVWLDEREGAIRGKESRKIIRQENKVMGPS
ncbi:RnfABCDGE type electron transport complex subunit B [Marinoscillum sp. MHG1-6]|uniref:RnfABCDGE type electron transport complex subunit B n=1 Tax=Marinoscillum sp. MHG1-6 TaxID=2959627 RepID=UPI0021589793|nr:RnfABCDGE type electron transport complex subunit B [Marinoscillum sp. MHG1-6]